MKTRLPEVETRKRELTSQLLSQQSCFFFFLIGKIRGHIRMPRSSGNSTVEVYKFIPKKPGNREA